MFIREIQLDGYGALRDVRMTLDSPITVVYGANEAGKSTLIRFIRSMLYGFPTRKDPVERGEPSGGGRHGGRLIVLAAGGRELMAERFADGAGGRKASGGGWSVREASGAELRWSQAEWERLALGGVSERLFRQLFSVSLDELHELHTLQGEEIGNYLYHAGLAGGASLSEARRRLNAGMDKLYKSKGTNQEINRLLSAIKETEAAVRQSRSGVALYRETGEALRETERRLAELEASMPAILSECVLLEGTLELREWWLKRRILEAEEAELLIRLPAPPPPPLPEDAAVRWSNALRRLGEATERLEKSVQDVRELRAEREKLQWDEALLEISDELEKLEAMREAAAARQEEGESVAAEIRLLEETVESLAVRLSPEWNDEDLLAFGSVVSEREPLRRIRQEWEEAGRALERLESEAGRLERQREALRSDETLRFDPLPSDPTESDGDALGVFRPRSREALQQAWNDLEDEWRRLERTAAVLQPQPDGLADSRRGGSPRSAQGNGQALLMAGVSALLAFVAAALLALGAVRGGDRAALWYAAAAVPALIALGFGQAAWRRYFLSVGSSAEPARNADLDVCRRRVEERLGHLLVRPERAAASLLGDSAPLREDAWKRLRTAVQREGDRFEREEKLKVRAEERNRRLSELDREKEALEADIRRVAARLDELEREWSRWLQRWKLPSSLLPDSVPDLLGSAEQGLAALRMRSKARERLEAIKQLQSAFRESAASLLAACPPPAALAHDAALAVSWLYRRAAEQRSAREEAERAERLIRDAEAEEQAARRAVEEAEAELEMILREADAPDRTAYEQRLQIDERRRAIARERREIDLRLEAGRSLESRRRLFELLATNDEAGLAALHRQALDAKSAAEQERTSLLERRGRLAQELDRLRRESETEDRLLQLSEMESRLEQLVERYAVLALADRLIRDTKAVFEEERQPEVIRLASRYFSAMTGGAYARILAPGGTFEVYAETADRRRTESAYLSRGTQEQLYLAMRFALADAASRDEPLPLLLDDLFVHFDGARLAQTVPVLEEISRTRQVILFTCHRHVADAVRRGIPSAQITEAAWRGEGNRSAGAPDPAP